MTISTSWLTQKITQYLIVHIFLTLASLPIIILWGLPFSRLAPLGNFIFNPILFFFLLLSSIIFFCEMFYIPHGFVTWLLEKVTICWQWLLTHHGNDTLYALPKPPLWLLIGIAFATFAIITHPSARTPYKRLLCLVALLCASMLAIEYTSHHQTIHTHIACHGGNVTLIHHKGKTILIDPGYIGRRISAQSWTSYTLVPELILKTGNLTIDYLITLKPGIMACNALQTLCDTITIRNIYIPYMYGTLEPSVRIAWGKLYSTLQHQNSNLVRIYENQSIDLTDDEIYLRIQPQKQKKYREITYPLAQVNGYVDDIQIDIGC